MIGIRSDSFRYESSGSEVRFGGLHHAGGHVRMIGICSDSFRYECSDRKDALINYIREFILLIVAGYSIKTTRRCKPIFRLPWRMGKPRAASRSAGAVERNSWNKGGIRTALPFPILPYSLADLWDCRFRARSSVFRRRMDLGVTSTISSSRMK
jgi:hypothetical protein